MMAEDGERVNGLGSLEAQQAAGAPVCPFMPMMAVQLSTRPVELHGLQVNLAISITSKIEAPEIFRKIQVIGAEFWKSLHRKHCAA